MTKQFIFLTLLALQLTFQFVEGVTQIEDKAQTKILTPDFSERKTRKLRLDNGLEAYLISDPRSDKSGAALSVAAGSLEDPNEYPGLAHFLEHMLFLGTKNYPQESEYYRFISQHGGTNNAFTSHSNTSFLFSIDNKAFDEALTRFSDFFKEPLFNPSGVARELQAVDQEYAMHLDNDEMRSLYIDKELANPDHPFHRFHIGNSDTLEPVSREVLRNWYEAHYHPDKMRLIVLAAEPLDKLQDLVVKNFEGIPKRGSAIPDPHYPQIYLNDSPSLVYIEPVKNKRTLTLIWELPEKFIDMKDSQPWSVVCHVLGHESDGSLLDQLKQEGLAENLGCSTHKVSTNNLEFLLRVELTEEGVKHVNTVIERIFQAITLYKASQPKSYLFDEVKTMATLNYQYQPRAEVFDTLMDYISNVFEEEMSSFPEKNAIVQKFDPEAIQEQFAFLTPQRARYYLLAPSQLTEVKPDRKEQWMGASYAVRPISEDEIKKWAEISLHPNISWPVANSLVPDKLTVTTADFQDIAKGHVPKPTLVLNNDRGKIYFAQDKYFKTPQVSIFFEIRTPQIDPGSALKSVLADLYIKSLKEQLNRYSYHALLAGLKYRVENTQTGISLHIFGYSQNAAKLLEKILDSLQVTPTKEQFLVFQDSLKRDYQNFQISSPVSQTVEYWRNVLYKKFVLPSQKVQAINQVSFEKFQDYVKQLYEKNYIVGMLYGNLTSEEAKGLTNLTIKKVSGSRYVQGADRRPQVIVLPNDQGPFFWEVCSKAQGNALFLAIQGPSFSFKERAAQQIFMQAIKEPFFSTLRTKQQTGYLVASEANETEYQLFNFLIVQSKTHTPRDLLSRFEQFIESFLQELPQELNEERFQIIKQSLITVLSKPANDIEEMGGLLEKIAFTYDGDFNWMINRIQGFNELSYSEFLERSNQFMSRENRKRFGVLLRGSLGPEKMLDYTPITKLKQLKQDSSYTNNKR